MNSRAHFFDLKLAGSLLFLNEKRTNYYNKRTVVQLALMAELSSAEAYIAGPKGREYAAVALDRADSSAKPWAWVTGGRSPACHPSHVAANAGFGAEPQEVRSAHFNSATSTRRNRRLAHGILNADASIQFGIQFFKERRQHCGVETDALTDGNGAYLPERVMSFGFEPPGIDHLVITIRRPSERSKTRSL